MTAPSERPTSVTPGALLLGVKEGYERWASSYDHAPNPVIAREERYLESLIPSLRGKNVLDLACGTGRWLEKMVARGAGVGTGIDCSKAMLRIAAKKSSLRRKLTQGLCEELPFARSVFDFAICSFALGHIQNLRKLGRELASVMKVGGEVFVSDLHPEAYARGWRTGFRDARSAVQIELFPHTPEEVIQTFCPGGFECLSWIPLCLGEPERSIFVRANKEHWFAEACRIPAVLVFQFKRGHVPDRGLR